MTGDGGIGHTHDDGLATALLEEMFDRIRQRAGLPQAAEVLLKVGEAANDDGLMKGTAKRAADECGQLRAGARNRLLRNRCCSKRVTCERLLGHRTSPLLCGA